MGVRNNWYHSYNSIIIEIGAQKSQSGPIAWPNRGADSSTGISKGIRVIQILEQPIALYGNFNITQVRKAM